MPSARPRASVPAACGLCALGMLAAAALATPATGSHHRFTHATFACRHAKHRHCPAGHAESKPHRKHRRGARSKPSVRKHGGSSSEGPGSTGSSTAPGAPGAAPGVPGSTPGSGATPPGASGGTSLPEPPTGPAVPAHVQVTAQDTEGFRFVLSRASVPAGEVIIEFVNRGQDEHNLHALEPAASTEAGSLPNTAPGAHPQLKLNLRPGSYTLFCSLPGHEAKGMKATLTVQ